MAWTALLKADLLALSRSWVLRGWLIILALFEFVSLTSALKAGPAGMTPASVLLSSHLSSYLFIWSTAIIVLSAGSVSLEADIIADGVLSRACTRTQYIAAKLTSRALVIVGAYALFASIAGYCTWRYASGDMSAASAATGIAVVGLAILLLVTLGVTLSVILNNTLFAVMGLFLLWYVASPVFSFLGGDYLSPMSLTRNLPRMLKDTKAPEVLQCEATTTSLTVTFSKDMGPGTAEDIANYVVRCPEKKKHFPRTAAYDRARTSVVLGGLRLPAAKTAKVTVTGVLDVAGNEVSPSANYATATVTGTPEPDEGDGETGRRGDGETGRRGDGETAEDEAVAEDATSTDEETTDAETGKKPEPKNRGDERRPLRVTGCTATGSSLKVTFSRAVDPKTAEKPLNYVVESPTGTTVKVRAAAYDSATRTALLSGFSFREGDPVKVTVRNLRDTSGGRLAPRGTSALYTDVTTWKYVLGFGIPTLLFALLGMVAFSRRDL